MKFVFVMGGSYKGFYINKLPTIKNVDLLIFNQNIFYDFDYEQEYLFDAPVTKELIDLNLKLKCPIVVYGYCKFLEERKKCFIICVNGKVSVINANREVYLYIKGKLILIGNKLLKSFNTFASICMLNKDVNYSKLNKKYLKNYFLCNKKGVACIQGNKIYRKFRKCCYFSLCFYKKMI